MTSVPERPDHDRLAAIERRLEVIEAAQRPTSCYVVMHEIVPQAVYRTEAEAESHVRRLERPGATRLLGGTCWHRVPLL